MRKIKKMFPKHIYNIMSSTSIVVSKVKTSLVKDQRVYSLLNEILSDKKNYDPELVILIN